MGTPSITDPKARHSLPRMDPLLEGSSSQKPVPVTSTPISEEVNDDDHETSDQVTSEPRRSTRL